MNGQEPGPALPPVVDRKTWLEAREALFVREKAHTHEGDAIAAARRRLPMVELDATIEVIGPNGPITILDVFEGPQTAHLVLPRLVARSTSRRAMRGLHVLQQPGPRAVLHPLPRRHVRHALQRPVRGERSLPGLPGLGHAVVLGREDGGALLQGRDWQRHHLVCYVRDGERVFETYYTGGRGVEIMAPTHGLWDMTVYGRQEAWEDSPDGWPQPWGDAKNPEVWRTNGRPIAQWSRIESGRSDKLT